MIFGIGDSGRSWKTTIWGIVTAICGMATMAGAFLVPAVAVIAIPIGAGMVAAGGGLIMAKDKDVTGVKDAQNPKYEAVTPEKKIEEKINV